MAPGERFLFEVAMKSYPVQLDQMFWRRGLPTPPGPGRRQGCRRPLLAEGAGQHRERWQEMSCPEANIFASPESYGTALVGGPRCRTQRGVGAGGGSSLRRTTRHV